MGKNRAGFILKIAEKRTTFNWIFYLLVLFLGKGGNRDLLAGIPLIIAGAVLRLLSSGTIKKNEILTDTGPYRMCRHPLYLGSLLVSLGFVIASRSIPVLAYFLVFFPMTYIPAMLNEERYLEDKFKDAYILYRKQTPAFIPRLRTTGLKNFSWAQVIKNGEQLNWYVIFFLLTAALIKSNFILQK